LSPNKWFRLAAEQGESAAQANLGYMYANGYGVPEDDAEAIKWVRLAAEQGYAKAQNDLGLMYVRGEGVPENIVMAYVWWSVSTAQGDEDAKANRDMAKDELTSDQLAQGEEIATRCFESDYKDCGVNPK
jgi:TPR repeat protein